MISFINSYKYLFENILRGDSRQIILRIYIFLCHPNNYKCYFFRKLRSINYLLLIILVMRATFNCKISLNHDDAFLLSHIILKNWLESTDSIYNIFNQLLVENISVLIFDKELFTLYQIRWNWKLVSASVKVVNWITPQLSLVSGKDNAE